jgi:hypothetical protein
MDNESLEAKESKRFKVLRYLYDATEQNIHHHVELSLLCKDLDITLQELEPELQYLEGENLIKYWGPQHLGILHNGIKEVEEALGEPDKRTEHFRAYIINVGEMHNSLIQQGTVQSYQTAFRQIIGSELTPENRERLGKVLDTVKKQLPTVTELSDSNKQELGELIEEITGELQKDNYNRMRLSSLLLAVATAIQTVGSLNDAYNVCKAFLNSLGITLP